MKWTIKKPSRKDWLVALIYWVFAIPFIIYGYIMDHGWAVGLMGMGYNILLDTLSVFSIVFIIVPTFLPKRQWVGLLVALIVLLTLSGIFYNFGYTIIFNWDAEYTRLTPTRLLWGLMNSAQSFGVFAMLLMARQYVSSEQRSLKLEAEKRESELQRLRAHIDPHFLFNNLNILDVLIEQNPGEARQFLRRLSDLYRYLIRQKDNDVVPLEEEWAFAENYVYLLQRRFGKAYHFQLSKGEEIQERYIPPGALQTLIENTVKHNQGDDQHPIRVEVEVQGDAIRVWNTLRPKLNPDERPTGTGLANLRARYDLLSDQSIDIQQTQDSFEVRLPLLKLA
jgi:sensor histidine kinase YesM